MEFSPEAAREFTILARVPFVTAVLGISIFLLLTFILSLLSRINLLGRQIASIESMIKESDRKLQEAQALIEELAAGGKKDSK